MNDLPSPPRQRRRRRFSLSALLLLVSGLAIAMGWLAQEARRARGEEQALNRLAKVIGNGQLNVMFGPRFGDSEVREMRDFLPEPTGWRKRLVEFLEVDIFITVKGLTIYGVGNSFSSGIDEQGRYAPKATYVSGLRDEDASLLAQLPHLDFLMLEANPIGDLGLASLQGLQELKHLNLASTQITDQAATHLARLRNLEVLDLSRTKVADDCAQALHAHTTLKNMNLELTWMSEEALTELREQLPRCEFGD